MLLEFFCKSSMRCLTLFKAIKEKRLFRTYIIIYYFIIIFDINGQK
jgi:hypothetical protein